VFCSVNWFSPQPRCSNHRVYAHTWGISTCPRSNVYLSNQNQSCYPKLVPLDLIRPECMLVHTLLASADTYVLGVPQQSNQINKEAEHRPSSFLRFSHRFFFWFLVIKVRFLLLKLQVGSKGFNFSTVQIMAVTRWTKK
jgi:hypothetical protein